MSHETRLKLDIPVGAQPELQRHPIVAALPLAGEGVELEDTYYDTPHLHLKARQVAVRIRRQGSTSLQTVRCSAPSTDGLSKRPKWEQSYDGSFDFSQIDDAGTARLLARHADQFAPVFTIRFRRETRRYAPREGISILLMIDQGMIEAGGRSAPISELALKLKEGKPVELFELASELARELPLMPNDRSKAAQAHSLFLDKAVEAVRAQASTIASGQNVIDAFRAAADGCVRQWQGNMAAATNGHPAPEVIHQVRVSLRRLRSLVKLFAPALPSAFVADWKVRLREAAELFRAARDLDVFHSELLEPAAAEGLAPEAEFARLQAKAAEARRAARETAERNLDPSAQGRLILEFRTALLRLPTGSLAAAADLRTFARLSLARLRKRGRRRADAAADLAPDHLHALRIGLKELRYATEFFSPLFPEKWMRRYLTRLTRAQDTLGFLQDLEAARGWLNDWAVEDAELGVAASFVLGWHAPRQAKLRSRVLHDCESVLWGKTPW